MYICLAIKNKSAYNTSLYLRVSKKDAEALGRRRMLQCSCPGECEGSKACPFAISKELLDEMTIEDTRVAKLAEGDPASKDDIIKAWRNLYGKKVTGHSARRSGALQYIRRGWRAPQVAYLGRWKSNVILQYYAEEALATMPVMPSIALNQTAASHDQEMDQGRRLSDMEIADLKVAKLKLGQAHEETTDRSQGT